MKKEKADKDVKIKFEISLEEFKDELFKGLSEATERAKRIAARGPEDDSDKGKQFKWYAEHPERFTVEEIAVCLAAGFQRLYRITSHVRNEEKEQENGEK